MIVAENLQRNYGSFVAVQDVSFEISRGQIVGLLGHNGAGKTTIMKMLTGFLEPTSGRVLIDGVDVCQSRLSVQQKIGYLPENAPLYPEMNVVEYLDYVCDLRSIEVSKRNDAISSAIERTWLSDKAFDRIDTLSKGYRQRVGVAQAILHSPEILILDEPTNGLDPSQIQAMRSLIRNLSEHATILLSTHIMQEVEAVCDRVIIVLHGNLAKDAQLDDLKDGRRLLLTVDQAEDVVDPVMKDVSGVKGVRCVNQRNGHKQYALELENTDQSIASSVAKRAIESGWQLFQLEPEHRDLETIFREISQSSKGSN